MTTVTALFLSVTVSSIAFVFFCLLYLWLSSYPGNAVVFFPARILSGLQPPDPKSRLIFGWLWEAARESEDEVMTRAGLDAAIYLKLQATCIKILVLASVFCLPVLIPINLYGNYTRNSSLQSDLVNFDKLSMANMANGSSLMWAHAVGAWWLTISTLYILLHAYSSVSRMRGRYAGLERPLPDQYAVLVRDIPSPPPAVASHQLIHDRLQRSHQGKFERALLVPKLAKPNALWTELESAKRSLAHARAVFDLSKTPDSPEGTRPRHKTGFLGLLGSEVDSIEFWTDKVEDLLPQLLKAQETAKSQSPVHAAIALFRDAPSAAVAAQSMLSSDADRWRVEPAPEPADMIWENVSLSLYNRFLRSSAVYALTFVTILFYMVPISFISGLTTLENLESSLPFLSPITKNPTLSTILQAFLPQLALIMFLLLLPYLLQYLTYLEGIPSKGMVDRAAASKYYLFQLLDVFIGFTLTGTLFTTLGQLASNPKAIVSVLGESLPQQSTFFITYVALRFLVGKGMEISRVFSFAAYHIFRLFSCKTEEELRGAWKPGPLLYIFLVPEDLLIITLGLCYAIIAPMILPFALTYFVFEWVIMKNQALNVYVAEYDSRGRMWPELHSRILIGLLLAQVTLIGYFGIKGFWGTFALLPLPVLTVLYYQYSTNRFYKSFLVNSLDVADSAASGQAAALSADELEMAYLPDCLKHADASLGEGSVPLAYGSRSMKMVIRSGEFGSSPDEQF